MEMTSSIVSIGESKLDPLLGKPSERRVLIVHNPVAGWRRRQRALAVGHVLDSLGCTVDVRMTEHAGHAEDIARSLAADDCDILAVSGGDGTINEAINGLRPNGPVLAVIPNGTANVLAHEIGLSRQPAAIAKVIAEGQPSAVNIGLANGRAFAMMAGVGFDAHVVARVTPGLKRLLRKGAYVWRSLVQMPTFGAPRYTVTVDGEAHDAASAIVANGRYYAGKFLCAPEARLDQASFQVCLFKRAGAVNVMRYGAAMLSNRLPTLPDFEIRQGHVVEIEGRAGEPVQADGDIIAHLPVRITLSDRPLRILRPEQAG